MSLNKNNIYPTKWKNFLWVFCMTAVLNHSYAQDLQNGLMLYYPFGGCVLDSCWGNDRLGCCYDSSGYGRDGYLDYCQYVTDRFNNVNSALAFNGINSRAGYNQGNNIALHDQISISTWFRSFEYKDQVLFSKYDGQDSSGFELGITRLGEIKLMGGNGTGEMVTVKSPESKFIPGNWNHVVGIVKDSLWMIVLNGQVVASYILPYAYFDLFNLKEISVGYSSNGVNGPGLPYILYGELDEVRVYNRVLTSQEIAMLCDYQCNLNISANVKDATSETSQDGSIDLIVSGGLAPYHYSWNTGDTLHEISGLSFGKYYAEVIDVVGCSKNIEINVDMHEDGLIGYYPFDGNADDYSGNDNHCLTDNSNENYFQGVKGLAHDFNGIDDILELTHTLDISNGLTFSFWMQNQGILNEDNSMFIINKHRRMYSNHPGLLISSSYNVDNELTISNSYYYSTGASDYENVRSKFSSVDSVNLYPYDGWNIYDQKAVGYNTWTHCVFNVTPEFLQLWLNGKLIMEKIREHDTYINYADEPTYFGTCPYGGLGTNNYFKGLLDDIRIYNRPLTKEEIENLFTDICNVEVEGSITDETFPGAGNGSIELQVTGGSGQYNFEWNTGSTSQDLSGVVAGTYAFQVTDSFNCQAGDTFSVGSGPCSINVFQERENINIQDTVPAVRIILSVYNAVPPYEFCWSNDMDNDTVILTTDGYFDVTVTDDYGCSQAKYGIPGLTISCNLLINYSMHDISAHDAANGWIEVNAAGGVAPYVYQWNTGDTTKKIDNLPVGIYYVSVTDAQECSDVFIMPVNEPNFNFSGKVYQDSAVLEEGIVKLYRYENRSYQEISETEVNEGNYAFSGIQGGTYILLAIPYDINSDFLPTYRVNKQFWPGADKTEVTGDITGADIRLIRRKISDIGTGSISGQVLIETPADKLPGSYVPVHLLSDNNEQGLACVSDSLGNFMFTGIPAGSFELYAQRPGFECTGDIYVELGPELPKIENVEILIRGNDIYFTIRKEELPATRFRVYPSCALKVDRVTVAYELMRLGGDITVYVYSSRGELLDKITYTPTDKKGDFTIPLSHLARGIKFLHIMYQEVKETFYIVR